MPVMECSCGMIMSLPSDGSRHRCIRCGGEKLQLFGATAAFNVAGQRFAPPRRNRRQTIPYLLLAKLDPSGNDIRDGSHI